MMLSDKTPLEEGNICDYCFIVHEKYVSGRHWWFSKANYLLAEYFVGVPSGFNAVVSLADGGGGIANTLACCPVPPPEMFVDDGWFTTTSSSLSS